MGACLTNAAILRAPLCPAGHLPHEGGDWPSFSLSPIANVAGRVPSTKLPISPLVGEMSGRTEGGATELDLSSFEVVMSP
ncbi:MAG: hypothetical protein EOR78_30030 [Mesorhizobium sp.]|nr:MAG: hypothetical protein EOR49_27540 [Mesorhizobium sp.]RWM43366.1 MAG: hypothetical protein EOR76_29775 [Mesorhizobium sp.]RWM47981.1 MAG: hypothetical protein EOR78_30030 [Mesorhizobium sp.]RWM60110.1 MAG: hypothetical protein EOR79_09885 [Mesorhizobium sp.]RWM91425.1 MAG: hypothetical protein EOR85_29205 [Mesorhizobium sp.]